MKIILTAILLSFILSSPIIVCSQKEKIPPIADKTKKTDKNQDNTNDKNAIIINSSHQSITPSIINPNKSGELQINSNETYPKGDSSPTRLTDWLLVIFSGLLVFVTIGLIYFQRKITRNTERAYLIGGGPDVQKNGSSIITIHNAGRTPGFITKLQWKICLEEDFLPKVKVSKILKEDIIKGITGDVIKEDNVWPASEKFGLEHFIITNHSDHIGRIFFGQVDFKDIFGDTHYSTFKLRLHKGGSRTLPGSYSEDWK